MGWDKRGYYYRARKVNGHVVRDYIGTGEVAGLCAQMDAIVRQQRETEQATRRAMRAEMEALDEVVEQFDELTEQLIRAVLRAAGFHQHNRGEWRKRRELNDEITGEDCGSTGTTEYPSTGNERRRLDAAGSQKSHGETGSR